MHRYRILAPQTAADQAWLRDLWTAEWGGETMITRGRAHRLADLQALIAWEGPTPVGAATFHVEGPDCELTSLIATRPGGGVGSALLQAVEDAAREAGCRRVWLITSNDNLDALRFYQRRGYRLVAVYPGAIDAARRLKPTIPLVGAHGIPIHNELELEKQLTGPTSCRLRPLCSAVPGMRGKPAQRGSRLPPGPR